MWKKAALLAAILAIPALLAGCAPDDPSVNTSAAAGGAVDIIVPYATTTVSPDATRAPDALLISSEGKVVLNDDSVLYGSAGEDDAPAGADGAQYRQLRVGDASTAVSELQKRLGDLGYFPHDVSGVYDEATEQAVKLFERSYGAMQTGIATAGLQTRLFSADALVYQSDAYNEMVESHYEKLEEGDVGSNVLALQARLMELGYPIEEITGIYDDQTVKAVRAFYKAYDFKVRDYAVVDLQKELFSESARRYPTPQEDAPQATPQPSADEQADYGLKLGDSGTRVTQLQLRLVELGYLPDASGEYDQATYEAVRQFQIACRLECDGVASEGVQRALYAGDAPAAGEVKQIYALLQWGDSGDAVARLQQRLIELGYTSGDADGVFGDELVAIVKRFQATAGLEETGIASVELQEFIYCDTAPLSPAKAAEAQQDAAAAQTQINPHMRGDRGDEVIALQNRLAELGYYAGEADGAFGGGTERAVGKFQQALGIEPTGEASADLINILDSAAAPQSGTAYHRQAQAFAALAPNDAGDAVVELQRRLWELGFLKKEDIADSIGTFDDDTAAAVNEVMKVVGCKLRDGRASAEFQAFLFSDAAQALKDR
ncbi:MAG: peptidoglycan-binding domain-containing protein [Christensenellales bacterium]